MLVMRIVANAGSPPEFRSYHKVVERQWRASGKAIQENEEKRTPTLNRRENKVPHTHSTASAHTITYTCIRYIPTRACIYRQARCAAKRPVEYYSPIAPDRHRFRRAKFFTLPTVSSLDTCPSPLNFPVEQFSSFFVRSMLRPISADSFDIRNCFPGGRCYTYKEIIFDHYQGTDSLWRHSNVEDKN